MIFNRIRKKLAIIGASYLQIPLVEKAKVLGIETICFAWEEGAVCREISDKYYPISVVEKEKILQICKKERIDGITSIASDVAVPTVAFVAEKLGLVGNSIKSALYSTNKCLMRNQLFKKGINCPEFWVFSENDSIDDKIFVNKYPLIVKPADRSGSRGVCKVSNLIELNKAIKTAFIESFAKQIVIEKYIDGSEVSVEYISWQGKHYFLSITDKLTSGSPHFVELAHHQPTMLPSSLCDTIRQMTESGLDALDIKNGASHSEFLISNKGEVYVTEIGARMGGDFIGSELVQLSTGYDFVKGVIDIALGQFQIPVIDKKTSAGVWFYTEKTKSVYDHILNKDKYPEIVKAELLDEELHPLQNSADRSGYFIYAGKKRFLIQ